MSDGRLRTPFRVGLFGCAAVIAVLAFAPMPETPLTLFDKVNHILAFSVLAWLAHGSYPGPAGTKARWALLLLAYGLFIELVQYFIPYRSSSLLDLLADGVGILLYLAMVRLMPTVLRSRLGLRSY